MENEKYDCLLGRLRQIKAAAVAFSGGADSTLLLAAAREALEDRVLALTVVTPYIERQEVADALAMAAELGVRHALVQLDMPEGINTNPPERCYLCKRALYGKLLDVAAEAGFSCVLDGSNLDDLSDYRPGLRALRELNVESPLLDCGLKKADVRAISKGMKLRTWDKADNGCLLTRLPPCTRVEMEDLQTVEEAERFLKANGFRWVRVRKHGSLARIEVAREQRERLLAQADTVVAALEGLGFRHVTLDLRGYRLGSMNSPLT